MEFRLSLAGVAAVVMASWGLHAQPLEPYQPNTDLLPAPLEPNQRRNYAFAEWAGSNDTWECGDAGLCSEQFRPQNDV